MIQPTLRQLPRLLSIPTATRRLGVLAAAVLLWTTAAPVHGQEESVSWRPTWGTTSSGGSLSKTGPIGWNAGGVSAKAIVAGPGYLEFTSPLADAVCGLTARSSAQGFEHIDFGLKLGSDGSATVVEAGLVKGSPSPFLAGDRFRVAVEADAVRYYRNGILLYSSSRTAAYPLSANASLYTPAAVLADVVLSGNLLENVVWTSGVNVTAAGSDLAKSAGAVNTWDAGAISTRGIVSTDGYVEMTPASTSGNRMLGLSHGNTNPSYPDIDFALYLSAGSLQVFEAGVSRGGFGTYVAGDRLRVAVEGGVIRYRKNGALLYTSTVTPSFPLLVDTSLYSVGASLNGAVLSGELVEVAVPPPVFSAGTGHYAAPLTVVVSAPDPEAAIHYTLNGPDPTAGDPEIASGASLVIEADTVLRARAFKAGLIQSSVTTATYTFGPVTTEPVVWTNGVNVTAAGSDLAKSAGAVNTWDAGAVSTRGIASMDGYLETTPATTSGNRMLGLSRGDTNQTYPDIDFALYLSAGSLQVFEAGVSRGSFGTYVAGDRLRVAVEGGVIRYSKNGTLLYTSAVMPSFPLLVDTSLYSVGASLNAVVLSGELVDVAVAPPVFSAGTGHYGAPLTVVVSSPDPEAAIHYTLNGPDPTAGDPEIASGASLVVETDTVLRARAFKEGLIQSSVTSATYTFDEVGTEPVVWTNGVNVTAAGSDLAKSAGAVNTWDAGAISTRGIVSTDGYLEMTPASTSGNRMLGLSHGDTNQGYPDIDFALYLSGGSLQVFEAGVSRGSFGTYVAGDRLRVAVEGGVIRYRKNGALLYTSTVAPAYSLLVDCSLYSVGASINGAVLSGELVEVAVPPPVFSAATGHYEAPLTVVVSSPDPEAAIHYTLNGPDPTTANPEIASGASLVIEADTVLKARSFKAGLIQSSVTKATYTLGTVATEPVVWTNGVNVTATGSDLAKSGGAASVWDAGAVSTRSIVSMDGYLETTPTSTSGNRMLGLSRGDTNQNYPDIDFGLYLSGGSLQVFEAGVSRGSFGTYVAGDRLRVAVEGGVIRYRRNGALVYASTVTPSFPLLVDTSLYSVGASLNAVVLSGELVDARLAPPAFSPDGGAYSLPVDVAIQPSPSDATVYYTRDGTTPGTTSPVYSVPLRIEVPTVVKVRAWKDGYLLSDVAEASYQLQVAAPSLTPPPEAGPFGTAVDVQLHSVTPESVIHCSLTGIDPDDSYPECASPLTLTTRTDLRARAYKSEWVPSPVTRAIYEFNYGTLAPPALYPAPGIYETSVEVSLTAPQEVSVHYTTDGTPPTTVSPQYGVPFTLEASRTVRASSFRTDWSPSAPAEAAYEIKVAAPQFTPPAGSYSSPQEVAIASSTPGATIVYTIDGSDPAQSGQPLALGETVPIDHSTTVRAIARKDGVTSSDISEAAYAIGAATGSISAGPSHLLYAAPDRTAWAWGENQFGQLGTGTTTTATAPVRVLLDDVIEVAAGGGHSLARRGGGSIWAWGDNSFGQLGRTPGGTSPSPVVVQGLTGVTALVAGAYHSVALMDDGTVRSWGRNADGQLGNGTTEDSAVPVVALDLSDVIAVAAGDRHTLALRSDWSVWAWGANEVGQLGNGSWDAATQPIQVQGLGSIVRVAAGDTHSIAISDDGSLWAWGAGASGQLGTNAQEAAINVPIPVVDECSSGSFAAGNRSAPSYASGPISGASLVDGGLNHSVAYLRDPSTEAYGLWSWGREHQQDCHSVPAMALVADQETVGEIVTLSSAGNRNLALNSSGILWYWQQTADGPTQPIPVTATQGGIRTLPPEFSVAAGTYRTELSVTITAPTPGSTIYYTTDGLLPDTNSPSLIPGSSISITESTPLSAVAYSPDLAPSDVSRAQYVLKVLDPTFDPAPSGFDGPVEVTIAVATPGATIRYGVAAEPDETGPPVPPGVQVTLTPPSYLWVRSYRPGWEPGEAIGTYRSAVVTPVLTPSGGSFAEPVLVTVTTTTPGATLRYRTDSGEPEVFDTAIASGATIRVDRSMTLSVKAWREGLDASDTERGVYRFGLPAPTLHETRVDGPGSALYVTGATSVTEATVRCTTDGSEPTPVSRVCTRPMPIDSTKQIKARAFAYGWDPSPTAERTFTVTEDALATPVIALPPGSYPAARPVTISCSDTAATIHYTTTGDDPTTGDPAITSGDAILLDRSLTLKARAWYEGRASLVARADYVLSGSVAKWWSTPTPDATVSTSLVLKTDGSIWAWGANDRGQLGLGYVSLYPVELPTRALTDEVVQVATGQLHSVALRRDGTVWVWGANDNGQLGTGVDSGDSATPVPLGLSSIVAVGAGGVSSFALASDGSLWEWGNALREWDPPEYFAPHRRTDVDCLRLFVSGDSAACVAHDGEAWLGVFRQAFEHWPGHRGMIDFREAALFTDGGLRGGTDLGSPLLASKLADAVLVGARAVPWRTDNLPLVVDHASPAAAIGRTSVVRADGSLWQWVSYDDPGVAQVPDFAVFNDAWLLADSDDDGLTNIEELDIGTDPYSRDTNGDGIDDGTSQGAGIDPVSVDTDGDGLTNAQEVVLGTDPRRRDTDGDGVGDGSDVFPLDPARSAPGEPDPTDTTPPGITLLEPANAVLISSVP